MISEGLFLNIGFFKIFQFCLKIFKKLNFEKLKFFVCVFLNVLLGKFSDKQEKKLFLPKPLEFYKVKKKIIST